MSFYDSDDDEFDSWIGEMEQIAATRDHYREAILWIKDIVEGSDGPMAERISEVIALTLKTGTTSHD